VFDTLRVTEILRNGRNELVHGRYESARTLLASALRLAPGSGDVLYQVMVADLMLGDSVSAQRVYQSLLGQTQSYSYVALARGQFDAADLLARAKASTMFEEQGVKTNKAASIYWKSGYYRRAADLMDTLMVTDTSYFVGLLWGFHYELQLGDTATARTYLTILENLDKRNAVVQAFGHILRIGDSLKVARSAAERSALHLSAAGVFRVMQLPEESVDEAEMALREEPGNVEALLFLARAFELRSRPRRSIELYGQVLRLDGRNHLATAKLDSLRTALSRN
jgi:tetratricopeptide (TPR) repeat protein